MEGKLLDSSREKMEKKIYFSMRANLLELLSENWRRVTKFRLKSSRAKRVVGPSATNVARA